MLITRFLTPNGVAEVHDFMPVTVKADDEYRQRLVRRVSGVRGTIDLQMRLDARPDYARQSCSATPLGDGVLITGDGVRMGLTASTALTIDNDNPDNAVVCADIQLTRGDTALFVLEMLDGDDEPSARRGR